MTGSRGARPWAVVAGLGATSTLIALGAPLVLALAAVLAGRVAAERAVHAWSVMGWATAAALALVASLAASLHRRDARGALARGALLCFLLQPFVTAARRVEAVTEAGTREERPAWTELRVGALASAPVVEVLDAGRTPSDLVTLRVDGREEHVAYGVDARTRSGAIRVDGPFPAPMFVVRRTGGDVEAQGYVKLTPGASAFLEPGILPHRIYVRVAPGLREPTPASVHLRVQRGKLRVFDREVQRGEEAQFEGVTFSYSEGSAWVRVAVRREPFAFLLVAGALLLAAAVFVAARERRVASRARAR